MCKNKYNSTEKKKVSRLVSSSDILYKKTGQKTFSRNTINISNYIPYKCHTNEEK